MTFRSLSVADYQVRIDLYKVSVTRHTRPHIPAAKCIYADVTVREIPPGRILQQRIGTGETALVLPGRIPLTTFNTTFSSKRSTDSYNRARACLCLQNLFSVPSKNGHVSLLRFTLYLYIFLILQSLLGGKHLDQCVICHSPVSSKNALHAYSYFLLYVIIQHYVSHFYHCDFLIFQPILE
jgi:hypothetical protein